MHLEHVAVIDDGADHLVHVVRLAGAGGDDFVERILEPADGIGTGSQRSVLHVVLGNEGDELADQFHRLLFGGGGEIGHTRLAGVYRSTSELLLRHLFARYGLHHRRTGQEHVARVALHDGEVGQRGRVHRATGAGTQDDGDLRNDARSHHVALENLGIAGQRIHALLNTRTAGVVESDAGCAGPHGHVHHLAYLLGHRLGERTARYGEILCENINQTAVDRTVAGHHPVAVGMALLHAEIVTAVCHEHVELLETALVQEHLYPLTGSVLALGVLCVDPFLTAALPRFLAQRYQLRDLVLIIAHIVSIRFCRSVNRRTVPPPCRVTRTDP